MWRWVVGALVAPVVFLTLLFALAAIFGQTLVEVPGRWAFVPITAELAIPLAVTIWVVRRLVRPKPPN
jgi:predicted Kef-type K+ transport protein